MLNMKSSLVQKNLPSIRKDIKVNEVLSISGSDLIKYTSSSNVLYDYCMLLIAMGILDDDTIKGNKGRLRMLILQK